MNEKIRDSLSRSIASFREAMGRNAWQLEGMPDKITEVHDQGAASGDTAEVQALIEERRLDGLAMNAAAQALTEAQKQLDLSNAERDRMFANQLEHGDPRHPLPAAGTQLPGA